MCCSPAPSGGLPIGLIALVLAGLGMWIFWTVIAPFLIGLGLTALAVWIAAVIIRMERAKPKADRPVLYEPGQRTTRRVVMIEEETSEGRRSFSSVEVISGPGSVSVGESRRRPGRHSLNATPVEHHVLLGPDFDHDAAWDQLWRLDDGLARRTSRPNRQAQITKLND
jgi:hypothetical protein